MVRESGEEVGARILRGVSRLRFGDRYRATPRVDIRIYRPTGQRLSGEEIDRTRLVEGYCSGFYFLRFVSC
jgi:hypothetical protein